MDNLFVYYRISDKGREKEKLPYADKTSCILNARQEFQNMTVIADNCLETTHQWLSEQGIRYVKTRLGNAKSFQYMMRMIFRERKDEDLIYLLEDDYIHLKGSREKLLEGLQIADYVTLYDHFDKYINWEDGGSRFNYKKLKKITLYTTKSSHWRETDSTTMTFACKVKCLREDKNIWYKYTNSKIPNDFFAFLELTQNSLLDAMVLGLREKEHKAARILFTNMITHKKMRTLISAVPASSTHAEIKYLAPVVDWSQNNKG